MRRWPQAFLLMLFSAARGPGQNLILNPDFDFNLAGWVAYTDAGGSTVGHGAEDAGGDPESGSMTTTTVFPQFSTSGVSQCAGGVVAATAYDVGCDVFIPESQGGTGEAVVQVTWYSSSDCTTGELGMNFTPVLDDTVAGSWEPTSGTFSSPAGSKSALVALVSVLTSLTAHTARFDRATLTPQGSVEPPPGPNRILNPDFDFNLTGWVEFTDLGSTVGHAVEDAGGDPDSGSMIAGTAGAQDIAAGIFQCVGGIVAETTYDAGCRVFIPAGQAGTGEAIVRLRWYSSSDCTTGELGYVDAPVLDDAAAGFWEPTYGTFTSPTASNSALITIFSFQTGFLAHVERFDGVILAPHGSEPLPVLEDGFEGGSTSAWQVTVP